MSHPRMIIEALTDALPPEANARDELIALGMVATGVICSTPIEQRSELIEIFCALVRKGTATDLN